jgi:succinoglycan biosynthesis protein ExoA
MTFDQLSGATGIAIVIPALNEERHIAQLLNQLIQHAPNSVRHILVADGGSTDRTPLLVAEAVRRDDRVALVANPEKIQSAGINSAVGTLPADIDILIRMDAHAGYPDDYVQRLVASLQQRDADSVVVRLRTIGGNRVQDAIAAASNNAVGSGGSAHRSGNVSSFVDHGHHAAFLRSMFDKVGGYDCSFVANEDAELDYRIRQAGGKIWLDADIAIDYVPRKSLRGLAKQYWRYGQGRAQTFLKHKERLRARQVIPPLIFMAFVCAVLFSRSYPIVALPALLYIAAIMLVSFVFFIRAPRVSSTLIALVLPVMHLSWGGGFLSGVIAGVLVPRRSLRCTAE